MENKAIKLSCLALLIGTLALTGCKATLNMKAKKTRPDGTTVEGEVNGEFESSSRFLLSVKTLLATAGVFTSSDFEEFDPSEFYLEITEEESITTVENNIITLTVWDLGYVVATREFITKKEGTKVYFRDVRPVKDWAMQFIDIGDKLTYSLDLKTATDSSSVVSVSSNQGNTHLASTSFTATSVTTCGRVICKQ